MDLVTIQQLRDMRNRITAEAAMRARCMVVPVDPVTALCRVFGRQKMYVDLRDQGFAPHLMFEGFWEYWITDFIWRNVGPGAVAVDVGANHGYYTLLLADLVGSTGKVHAFEPNPRLAELLGMNVALNGYWGVVESRAVALSDRDGETARFLVPVRDPKNAHLLAPGQSLPANLGAAGLSIHDVPLVSLDAALPGRVDFIKIDVEGAEEAVWRGMQRVIERNPDIGIVMEFNPVRCTDAKATLAAMEATFRLREVTFGGVAEPCEAAEILTRREDTILYLSRSEPV